MRAINRQFALNSDFDAEQAFKDSAHYAASIRLFTVNRTVWSAGNDTAPGRYLVDDGNEPTLS